MAEQEKAISREKTIVRTGIIGIVANVLLASFKALVGLTVHSTAMILDAVNNFSDVLSSVVTIIGTKIASKKPDKKHPLGHGRAEYLAQMIIAALIIYAGITSLLESIKKIFNPVAPEHSTVSLIVISVAIVVKIVLGIYVKKQGKKARMPQRATRRLSSLRCPLQQSPGTPAAAGVPGRIHYASRLVIPSMSISK